MMTDNVTLIVKAPNQQIEDQNIQCRTTWTIGELKGHLSEVYPSKPTKEEQKIIYSGQLLDDNAVIKDILRNYEDQFTHTMHLVCTPKRNMTEKKNMAEKTEPSTDGLRHRNVPDNQQPAPTAHPEVRQNDQNHTVEMQNYLSSFVNNYGRVPSYPNYNLGQGYLPVPNDSASMANHMMMMQQAYMQYMQQYANMWQATVDAAAAPPPVETPPQPAPAVRDPEVDEGRQARDWLDHIYDTSRILILVSLLYVYGSATRLLLVIILAVMTYLQQNGFFQDLRGNLGNNEVRNEPQNEQRNNQPENDNGNEVPRAEQNGNRQEPNQTNEPANNENDQQSLLAVTWMIFTTFFASLIPDTN